MNKINSAALPKPLVRLATGDGSAEAEAATQALLNYFSAHVGLDPSRVAHCLHEPFMFISASQAISFDTRAGAEPWLKQRFESLKDRSYGHSEWPHLQAKVLSAGVVMVTTLIVRFRIDGNEMERTGATYLLRNASDGWQVAVLVAHNPGSLDTLA